MDDAAENDYIYSDPIIKEIKKKYKVHKNVWIIKPGENTNRGNGINVCSTLPEIKALI